MIIYLCGPDSYRKSQKLKLIQEEYKKKYPRAEIEHFNLDNGKLETERFKNFTRSQSLFDARKFGVIHNLKNEHKELKIFLRELSDDKNITLVLVSEKKLGKDFSFLFKKPALYQEFETLQGTGLVAFIKKEIANRNLTPSVELIDFLIKSFEGNLWGITTELEKISLGAKPEQIARAPEFFPLIQRIKNKGALNYKLPALTYLLLNDEPARVFNIIAAIAGSDLKIKMADLDASIKSGKLEYEEALLDLVLTN